MTPQNPFYQQYTRKSVSGEAPSIGPVDVFMNNARLKVQINDYDTYQTHPLKLDQLGRDVSQVPIIRVFGSLSVPLAAPDGRCEYSTSGDSSGREEGKFHSYNVLVHVHNYYPYLYVDCFEDEALLCPSHINRVVDYLENSLLQSFQRRKTEDEDEDAGIDLDVSSKKRKFIAKVAVCKGSPMYGYSVGYKLFYKISLLSPLYKTRLTALFNERKIDIASFISSGTAGGDKAYAANVYEAHIPYLMQFLADFNLFGCGWMELNNVYFRYPIFNDNTDLNTSYLQTYLLPYIKHNNVLDSASFARIGRSLLEFDIITNEIHNRSCLKQRKLHHDFVEKYRHESGILNSEIYLSSLNHIYKDLKFQCESRGAHLSETQYSQNSLGVGGTSWENQSDLTNLLEYVISLTKRTSIRDFKHYYKEYIEAEKYSKFPTAFELIDIEKMSNFCGGISLLTFENDLIRWHDYDLLFNDMMNLSNINTNNPMPSSIELDTDDFSDAERVFQGNEKIELEYTNSVNNEVNEDQYHMDHDLMVEFSQRKQTKRSHSQTMSSISQPSVQVPSSFNVSFDDASLTTQRNIEDLNKIEPYAGTNSYEVVKPPELNKDKILETFDELHLLKINYLDPHYAKPSDVPAKPLIFANKKINISLINDASIKPFEINFGSKGIAMSNMIKETIKNLKMSKEKIMVPRIVPWVYAVEPPLKEEIQTWVDVEEKRMKYKRIKFESQVEPPITQSNDFKFSYRSEKVSRRPNSFNSLTNLHLEIHANTHNALLPNPNTDPITMLFYNFSDSNEMFTESTDKCGILIYDESSSTERLSEGQRRISRSLKEKPLVEIFRNEKSMIDKLIKIVESFDPDILSGYEINASSWGYVIERFRNVYEINLLFELSRCKFKSNGKFGDRWGYTHTSAFKINGRHLLNVWRLLRSELSLTNYSLENISYHLLHQTLPKYLNLELTLWLSNNIFLEVLAVYKYYLRRVHLILKIIDIQELITKNVEQSRLIGIDFNSNFYRGSQFKVESILCRLTKLENLLLNSVSKQQLHEMKSLECIPLIMEPDSNFYKSPLIVLDFQSLYPSIIIAYNYCYSTILGKLHGFEPKKNSIGYLNNLQIPPGLLDLFEKNNALTISPNGYVFVKSFIRKSMLAKMLEEILNARINVKSVMKLFKDDPELIKLYNSRQLALKLMANVTYGYTSATFSGRMPNSDIADAIVSTGREILTQSIRLIEMGNYGAKVVYGDTDSLFVYLPGKSKRDAFKIGNKIANFITEQFPNPVKLKFEKVYHPCLLLAKKRYVGYSYEYEDQQEPKFDAKGIETIRRDGIPAQQKMVEKTIRILFETKNISLVKKYTMEQFYKILINKVSIKDFCFAKEVRYGTYKNEAYLPPGAIVADRNVSKDPRSEPQYRERVPYLIYQDSTKIRVKDRCISPEDFVKTYSTQNPLSLDNDYYISRVLIPPLERVFNLIGVDVKSWYKELPKFNHELFNKKHNILNISSFIKVNSCLYCGSKLKEESKSKFICNQCLQNELELITELTMSIKRDELKVISIGKVCETCVNRNYEGLGTGTVRVFIDGCVNHNCAVYFNRIKALKEKDQSDEKHGRILNELLEW